MFDRCLTKAGYLDAHEPRYSDCYVVKEEELFSVRAGFPRIIELQDGVGNLRYSVVLGACQEYRVSVEDTLNLFRESPNA